MQFTYHYTTRPLHDFKKTGCFLLFQKIATLLLMKIWSANEIILNSKNLQNFRLSNDFLIITHSNLLRSKLFYEKLWLLCQSGYQLCINAWWRLIARYLCYEVDWLFWHTTSNINRCTLVCSTAACIKTAKTNAKPTNGYLYCIWRNCMIRIYCTLFRYLLMQIFGSLFPYKLQLKIFNYYSIIEVDSGYHCGNLRTNN